MEDAVVPQMVIVTIYRQADSTLSELNCRTAQDPSKKIEDHPMTPAELREFHEREQKLTAFISNIRLELAKLNREVLRYTVAIDEVPGTAELLQYEKRFLELYNQGKLISDTGISILF